MICISNTRGNNSYVYYEHNGKVGRPKKIKSIHKFKENDIEVEWNLHILLVSKPTYAFREIIKRYIDKNWVELKRETKELDINEIIKNAKTYKKNTNIKKAEYFINQSDEILFCNYSYTNEKIVPDSYSLKDLYNAYMNSKTELRYSRSIDTNKRLALEDKYNEIVSFYLKLTKEQDGKMIEKFMKEMKLIKIAENYERIENNKVQEIFNTHHKRIQEDTWF